MLRATSATVSRGDAAAAWAVPDRHSSNSGTSRQWIRRWAVRMRVSGVGRRGARVALRRTARGHVCVDAAGRRCVAGRARDAGPPAQAKPLLTSVYQVLEPGMIGIDLSSLGLTLPPPKS